MQANKVWYWSAYCLRKGPISALADPLGGSKDLTKTGSKEEEFFIEIAGILNTKSRQKSNLPLAITFFRLTVLIIQPRYEVSQAVPPFPRAKSHHWHTPEFSSS